MGGLTRVSVLFLAATIAYPTGQSVVVAKVDLLNVAGGRRRIQIDERISKNLGDISSECHFSNRVADVSSADPCMRITYTDDTWLVLFVRPKRPKVGTLNYEDLYESRH